MTKQEKIKLQKLEARKYLTYRRYKYVGMDELSIKRANASWFALWEFMSEIGVPQDLTLPEHDEAFKFL